MIFEKKPVTFLIFLAALFVIFCIAAIMWQPEKRDMDHIIFNNEVYEIPNIGYYTDALMIDLEHICNLMDATTERKGRTITINRQDKEMEIKLYSTRAKLNDERIYLYRASIIRDGRVYVHIRTVCDKLGLIMGGGSATRSINQDFPELEGRRGFCIYTPEYMIAKKAELQNTNQ